MLYPYPMASARTNEFFSKPFTLHQGAKQGCPISGLLFNLVIEPFAEKIRTENNIKGIYIGSQTYKISLYCDDIILYLTHVESSLLHLSQIITHYSSLSGYKVNWEKCELMPFNKTRTITWVRNTKIKWKQTELTYLGLKITSSIYQTRDINLTQTYKKIRANIDRWSSPPISLWGRINIVKMNILPTVNYILKSWFDNLHKAYI